uniref:Bromodomain-containing protein 8 n=1 Tax=Latimeria chalumnae TaxID=7897 RepID=H3BCD5_LATCH
MAAGAGKHKLISTGPTEPWSIREKLCLASSVMRSGDQNWVSVSRAIKPFAESGRPPDWFSQKHCASQYSELLETTETPKRKRGEKGEVVETVEDVIVRKLTAERIEELKKMMKETQEKYRKLKKEAELIQAGQLDSKLEEIWNEIVTKKKQEEEQAEVKRKATDAAYQARQAAKNAPKRLPSVTVRSPLGSTSPGVDYPMVDTPQSAAEEGTVNLTPGTVVATPVTPFIAGSENSGAPSAPLESPLTPVIDDSPQKKLLGQKATPPPSPLLSELLKKGSLLPSSPRLANEGDASMGAGYVTNPGVNIEAGVGVPPLHSSELQLVPSAVSAIPAASGAPTLSRLLEAGPAQFNPPLTSFSAVASDPQVKPTQTPLESKSQAAVAIPSMVSAASIQESPVTEYGLISVTEPAVGENSFDQPAVAVSVESTDISMIIDSIKKECLAQENGGEEKEMEMDEKGELDLEEKMAIAVSYTGAELDLETVGDIIAIIEDKVDDHSEVLDAAAVEAALSLCEEAVDSHTLTDPWDPQLKPEEEKQEQTKQTEREIKEENQEGSENKESNTEELKEEMTIKNTERKHECTEQEQIKLAAEETAVTSSKPSDSVVKEEATLSNNSIKTETDSGKEDSVTETAPKLEKKVPNRISLPPDDGQSIKEETPQTDVESKLEPSDAVKEVKDGVSNIQQMELQGEKEEDGASEAASVEEQKYEETGEGYMSEAENEPPISESDDGFSIHNAPLQSSALADSIPSSPASSQFSVCSEDQEAIQAQKIWKKAIMLVWRAAANHRYANVFLQPVTDDIAPGYHGIVQRPMDLSTIKKNIENGLIRTTAEFQRDIMLMFQNAVMYNSSDHDVYHMAVEMQRDVLEQIQQFLATQLIMQTSESGISTKSLRGRDSTRKQDSAEKDGGTRGRRCAIEADMKMKK